MLCNVGVHLKFVNLPLCKKANHAFKNNFHQNDEKISLTLGTYIIKFKHRMVVFLLWEIWTLSFFK